MKLELKHYQHYLDSRLQLHIPAISKRVGVRSVAMTAGTLGPDECPIREAVRHQYKPYLRPLSQINQEITDNGVKFVPAFVFDVNNSAGDSGIHLDSEESRAYFNEFSTKHRKHHLEFMPYGMIAKLVEWHFDVFGLIEAGLAIEKPNH